MNAIIHASPTKHLLRRMIEVGGEISNSRWHGWAGYKSARAYGIRNGLIERSSCAWRITAAGREYAEVLGLDA